MADYPIVKVSVTGQPWDDAPADLQALQRGFDGAVQMPDGSWELQRGGEVVARIMLIHRAANAPG